MKKIKYNFKDIMEGMLGTFGFKTPEPEPVKFADGVEEDMAADQAGMRTKQMNKKKMYSNVPGEDPYKPIKQDIFSGNNQTEQGPDPFANHPDNDGPEIEPGDEDSPEHGQNDADYERWRDDQLEQEDDHEHEAEYQPAEPDVNVPESNTCKHCGLDMPLPEPDPDFAHDDIPLPPPADEVEGIIARNDPGKARKQAQDHPLYHTAPAEDPNYDPDMPNFSFYRWMKQNEPGEFKKMVNYNKKKKGIPTEAKEYWNLMKTFAQLNEYDHDTKYKDEEANCPHDLGNERDDDKDWDEYDEVTNKEPRIDGLTSAQDNPDEEEEDKKVDEQSMKDYEQKGSEFSLKGMVMEKAFKDREGEYRKIGSVSAESENDPSVSDAFKGYPADEYWIRAIKKPNEGKFDLYVRKKPTKYTRTRVPKDLYDFVDEVVEDENKWYGHIPGSDNSEKD